MSRNPAAAIRNLSSTVRCLLSPQRRPAKIAGNIVLSLERLSERILPAVLYWNPNPLLPAAALVLANNPVAFIDSDTGQAPATLAGINLYEKIVFSPGWHQVGGRGGTPV